MIFINGATKNRHYHQFLEVGTGRKNPIVYVFKLKEAYNDWMKQEYMDMIEWEWKKRSIDTWLRWRAHAQDVYRSSLVSINFGGNRVSTNKAALQPQAAASLGMGNDAQK